MKKIFVAGHSGMVGSAILRKLRQVADSQIITVSKTSLDLTRQKDVELFFKKEKPEEVYLAAAKVGGVLANSLYPADFLLQNLAIQLNVIQSAFESGVNKLLFLGSSCIYPISSQFPIKEEFLLSGKLEPTNEAYAIAKITGIKICESLNRQFSNSRGLDFRAIMPTNLYGKGDNYHSENSHVIPGLIRKFHEAKVSGSAEVKIWGTGKPLREFLYVDDLAEAAIFTMGLSKSDFYKYLNKDSCHMNVGSGYDISIYELAVKIANVVGYNGKISFDSTKPDGIFRKIMDSSIINNLGWYPKISIDVGLSITYNAFLEELKN